MQAERPNANSNPTSRADGPEGLTTAEKRWMKHRDLFEAAGYRFRPRYRRGWEPSWKPGAFYMSYEDGVTFMGGRILDATRSSDGAHVIFKKIPQRDGARELEINQLLSSEPIASDPRNHTAQILDVLEFSGDTIIAMPQLRPFDSPPFGTYGEAVAFFTQIFEALLFMHEHNVAHRDCTYNNIMMDPSGLYPNSFHPVEIDLRPNFKGKAKHLTRTQRPPKYFFIDFGLSAEFGPNDGPPLVLPARGGDKSAPEHDDTHYDTLHDPFPTDVYYLGNLIREQFIADKRGFGFMKVLVEDMTAADPSKRPSIRDVVSRFTEIRSSLSSWKLRSRIVPRREFFVMGLLRSVGHWYLRAGYIITRKAAIPDP